MLIVVPTTPLHFSHTSYVRCDANPMRSKHGQLHTSLLVLHPSLLLPLSPQSVLLWNPSPAEKPQYVIGPLLSAESPSAVCCSASPGRTRHFRQPFRRQQHVEAAQREDAKQVGQATYEAFRSLRRLHYRMSILTLFELSCTALVRSPRARCRPVFAKKKIALGMSSSPVRRRGTAQSVLSSTNRTVQRPKVKLQVLEHHLTSAGGLMSKTTQLKPPSIQ